MRLQAASVSTDARVMIARACAGVGAACAMVLAVDSIAHMGVGAFLADGITVFGIVAVVLGIVSMPRSRRSPRAWAMVVGLLLALGMPFVTVRSSLPGLVVMLVGVLAYVLLAVSSIGWLRDGDSRWRRVVTYSVVGLAVVAAAAECLPSLFIALYGFDEVSAVRMYGVSLYADALMLLGITGILWAPFLRRAVDGGLDLVQRIWDSADIR